MRFLLAGLSGSGAAYTGMPLQPDEMAKNNRVQFPQVIISLIRGRQPQGANALANLEAGLRALTQTH